MAKCVVCGKAVSFGHNVSHSKRRTRRDWSPNIQNRLMVINGKRKRVSLCTRCLKSVYKVAS
ncbi:MAG: 50S ribosomal protein L28 [Chloroflexi bacterium]|nr:50S ribosomal protein L28 [Chloroflexota bacterium]